MMMMMMIEWRDRQWKAVTLQLHVKNLKMLRWKCNSVRWDSTLTSVCDVNPNDYRQTAYEFFIYRRFDFVFLVSVCAVKMASLWAQISGGMGVAHQRLLVQKTRVPGLSRGVACVILRLAVLTQYRRVTD